VKPAHAAHVTVKTLASVELAVNARPASVTVLLTAVSVVRDAREQIHANVRRHVLDVNEQLWDIHT